jgi:hypothetical protein
MKVYLPKRKELVFPWIETDPEDTRYPEAIKWKINNTSYEIYIPYSYWNQNI